MWKLLIWEPKWEKLRQHVKKHNFGVHLNVSLEDDEYKELVSNVEKLESNVTKIHQAIEEK